MTFTENDLNACWTHHCLFYFVQVLNGKYELEQAREDLQGLIGSEFDLREPQEEGVGDG